MGSLIGPRSARGVDSQHLTTQKLCARSSMLAQHPARSNKLMLLDLCRHACWVGNHQTWPPYSECRTSWTVSLRTEVSRMFMGNVNGPP